MRTVGMGAAPKVEENKKLQAEITRLTEETEALRKENAALKRKSRAEKKPEEPAAE